MTDPVAPYGREPAVKLHGAKKRSFWQRVARAVRSLYRAQGWNQEGVV